MTIIRAVFAVLISVSIATVPAIGSRAVPATEMAMADQADTPCCPCCGTQDDLKSTAACAVKCINIFAIVAPSMISLPLLIEAAMPSILNGMLSGHEQSPPTHPPPV